MTDGSEVLGVLSGAVGLQLANLLQTVPRLRDPRAEYPKFGPFYYLFK